MRHHRAVLVPLAVVALISGCGSSPDAADASAGSASVARSSGAAEDGSGGAVPEGGTCDQLAALGVSGGSFGPVQPLARDSVIPRIESTLVPLQSVEPAEEVAAEWAIVQAWLEEYRAAAEALPAGGIVQDPAIFNPGEEVTSAQDVLTDWWFATCA